VKVNNTTVGAIQTLTITEAREMLIQEEIGTSGIVEVVPKGATKVSLRIERVVFDQLSLPEALARGFVHIQAQRMPFDIHIINTSASTEETAVITVCSGCWLKSKTTPYTVNSFLIIEAADIQCERITTSQRGISAVFGGVRGIGFDYDTIERATDSTGRIGRFEPAGTLK
jgi:hypothetical protein